MSIMSYSLLHWNVFERYLSRDKQIPCAFQGMYRRMSVFPTTLVVVKIHAPKRRYWFQQPNLLVRKLA